ncbi:MAG: xylulokinase, partial [Actinomycetota bacterium]|nr:xylulokinase [Actinomycetota bacterium]
MSALVGIDVGTTSVKAVAISEDGDLLASAEEPYPMATPRPGWTEQNPADWALAAVAARERLGVDHISGVGLSGQMHGLVVLDSDHEVLRPAILWNDQRTADQCREIEDKVGLERLIALTGNRALTGFTAPKLLWLQANEPDIYRRIEHVMLPKDYVRFRLTGELATDVSDASGTLLFDVAKRDWSDEVLSLLEQPREWLPPALESPDRSGKDRQGVPVAAGAGDQAAAAVGAGIVDRGTLSISVGTSGVVFGVLDEYSTDPQARAHVFCHAVPGRWHAMGVMLSAAGSLAWLRNVLGADSYDVLGEEAERWPPGSEGATFLPYLSGERTPHADPDATASFTGLTIRHDRGALVRAVLEGVAYGLKDSLGVLREVGVNIERARVTGGGARGGLWLKIIASVLDIPLEVTEVQDASAYGAAL